MKFGIEEALICICVILTQSVDIGWKIFGEDTEKKLLKRGVAIMSIIKSEESNIIIIFTITVIYYFIRGRN